MILFKNEDVMRKKKNILLLIVAIISLIFIYHNFKLNQIYESIEIPQKQEYNEYEFYYNMLDDFFENHFMNSEYPITNLTGKITYEDDLPSEDDVLSESMGLLLQKYLKENNQLKFDETLDKIQKTFLKNNKLSAWKVHLIDIYNDDTSTKENTVNASVDDLRIVKALYIASTKFENPDYKRQALEIGESIKMYCTEKYKLLSFDSEDSPNAIWAYYDFESLYYLSKEDIYWKKMLSKNLLEIKKHQISNKPYFYLEKKEESYKSIENLMIVMHFAEIGLVDKFTIEFIKKEITKGAYYGEYNYKGEALNNIESPAIYGIIAQIAKLVDDYELYKLACEKLIKLTEFGHESYYGGYIDIKTQRGYSFDQLMAMLGY